MWDVAQSRPSPIAKGKCTLTIPDGYPSIYRRPKERIAELIGDTYRKSIPYYNTTDTINSEHNRIVRFLLLSLQTVQVRSSELH